MSYTRGNVGWMPHSIDNLTSGWMAFQVTSGGSSAWGTQYRAIYVPLRVTHACVVKALGVGCGTTATGNIDVGLYSAAGTRLVSSGSTAKSGTAAVQVVDVTDTTLTAGLYYIGLNNDTTTDTFVVLADSAAVPAARGLLTETLGSLTLPATATWVVSQTLDFVPIVSALIDTTVA